MSFLLDALRKSENQKRLGDVPSIHSTAGLESRSRSTIKPVLILLALLPAFIVVAWYGWQMYAESDTAVLLNDEQGVQSGSNETIAESTPRQDALPAIARHSNDSRPVNNERTPVETFSRPARSGSGGSSAMGLVIARLPATADAAPQELERAAETPVFPPEDEILADISPTSNSSEVLPVDALVQQASDYQQPRLEIISYWQLPVSVRQEMLEPRISVLVYAERPEDRFILMNGLRLVEGDEPSSGMVLVEIRRDGVVFSYRLYQFLVSR